MSVFPTIQVNSASGSNSAASGAGPATAKTGVAAATDGVNGKTITITDAVDLSGVAVDGSAALYLADATAGHRNFDQITAISGVSGNWTVTVANGFTISLSGQSWAIGGQRASLFGGTSLRLVDNNALSGDAMAGWTLEFESGHTETVVSTVTVRRAGDTTNGFITIQGNSSAATLPVITFSNNGNAFSIAVDHWQFQNFEMQNSTAGASAVAFNMASGGGICRIIGIKIIHATNHFATAISIFANMAVFTVESNDFRHCSSIGISWSGGAFIMKMRNNFIGFCGSHGYSLSATVSNNGSVYEGNIFAFNGGSGVVYSNLTTNTYVTPSFEGNVFHGNAADGIVIGNNGTTQVIGIAGMLLQNNDFTFNGGYGINFSGAGITDAILAAGKTDIRNNRFFSNTSGKYNGMTILSSQNELTDDPSSGLASATKDYAGVVSGTNFMSAVSKGKGWPTPLAVGTYSSSSQYKDIGLQHQDTGGGGGVGGFFIQ